MSRLPSSKRTLLKSLSERRLEAVPSLLAHTVVLNELPDNITIISVHI